MMHRPLGTQHRVSITISCPKHEYTDPVLNNTDYISKFKKTKLKRQIKKYINVRLTKFIFLIYKIYIVQMTAFLSTDR